MEIHIHDSLAAMDNPGPNSLHAQAFIRALEDTKDFDTLKLAQAVLASYSFFFEALKAGTLSPILFTDFSILSSLLAERLASDGLSLEEVEAALRNIITNGICDKK